MEPELSLIMWYPPHHFSYHDHIESAMHSGIRGMDREFVLGCIEHYQGWGQGWSVRKGRGILNCGGAIRGSPSYIREGQVDLGVGGAIRLAG